uniref:Uncharacterized protein n=1 Tax=Oryza punctata TaxID=4537 RepID=A0A0E0LT64_ORYPU
MITSFILRSSNPTTENYPTLPDPTVLAHAGSCSGREIARTRGDRPKIAQASKSIPAPSHTFLRTSPRLRAHTPIPSTAQIGATPDLTLALPHSATASPSNSSPSLHARGSSPIPYRRHRRSPSQPSASRLPLIPDRQFVVAFPTTWTAEKKGVTTRLAALGALPVCNLISSASLQHSIADTSPLVPMPWLLQAQNQSISETTITATSDKRCRCEVQRL